MRPILAADDDAVACLTLESAGAGLPEVSATVVEDGAVLLAARGRSSTARRPCATASLRR